MNKIVKQTISTLILFFLRTARVSAQSNWLATSDEPASFKDIETVFKNIGAIIIPFTGLTIFVLLIVGGFKFLTAGGNPENAAKAKLLITWAIIGLIVILMAWFILVLIKEITGIDVTKFELMTPSGLPMIIK